MRDYGLGQWQGGDAECEHKRLAKDRQKEHGLTDRLPGTAAYGGNAEEPWPDGVCGHCGAVNTPAGIGLEATLGEWVENIVAVGREVWRVLRDDGIFWLNCGDAYASTGRSARKESPGVGATQAMPRVEREVVWQAGGGHNFNWELPGGIRPKNLMGQPWRVAFALQDEGWILRSPIIWKKLNPMPGSQQDRPTSSYEYIFLLSKKGRYYFDGEPIREPSGAFCRDVWEFPTQGRTDSHFASFPDELPRRCILAGTSERGVCGECGSPWVRVVEKLQIPDDKRYQKKYDGTEYRNAKGNVGRKTDEWLKEHPVQTLGWQPTCGCGDAAYHEALQAYNQAVDDYYLRLQAVENGWGYDEKWPDQLPESPSREGAYPSTVPATVLDCFIGSGTTVAVAQTLGRRGVGLDLNPEYLAIAQRRIESIPLPMLL